MSAYAYVVAIDDGLICVAGPRDVIVGDYADAVYQHMCTGVDRELQLIALHLCRDAADIIAYCRNAWTGGQWPVNDDYDIVAVADCHGVRWHM